MAKNQWWLNKHHDAGRRDNHFFTNNESTVLLRVQALDRSMYPSSTLLCIYSYRNMLSHSFLVFTVNTNSNLVKEPRYTSQCDSALKLKLYKVMYKYMPNRCIYHGRERSWIFQPPRCLIYFSVVNTDIRINTYMYM